MSRRIYLAGGGPVFVFVLLLQYSCVPGKTAKLILFSMSYMIGSPFLVVPRWPYFVLFVRASSSKKNRNDTIDN